MSSTQRTYVLLLCLLLMALGALWHSNSKLTSAKELTSREKTQLEEVKGVGQLVFNHKELVKAQNTIIDKEKKGNLEMNKILSLTKKHSIKTPATSKESLSIKRTYSEKILSLKLRDEELKSVILFMLDVEALGNAKVTKIDIARNPKNRDVWNADITVAQRIKKEES